jgi:hypothetical protein
MLIQESFTFKNKLFASGFESIFGSEFLLCPKYHLCRIKLILSGKVLNLKSEVATHGVRNGTQMMAVVLHSNPKELQV